MLQIYRRHQLPCPYTSRRFRSCKCPIWVQGSLGGEYVRKSLDLRSWSAASALVHRWEASGKIGVVREDAPTLREAVTTFIESEKGRHVGHESIRKYTTLLDRQFVPWCEGKGLRELKQITPKAINEFRTEQKVSAIYAVKSLERLRAFFRFVEDCGWIEKNPAKKVKSSRVKPTQKLPFTGEEMQKILAATEKYRGDRKRIKAFILVMRYSGVRISDAIGLRRDALKDCKIWLRTEKTGVQVWVPLPPFVVQALRELPEDGERFFWNGRGKLTTRVANWSRYLASVFRIAKVDGAHSHRFRHTFATTLLQKGTSVENVATLLGNSPRIVHKHYAAWIKERQEILEEEVRATWA